jgi:hypothetical protein
MGRIGGVGSITWEGKEKDDHIQEPDTRGFIFLLLGLHERMKRILNRVTRSRQKMYVYV